MAAALLLGAAPGAAQDTGRVAGVVIDQTNAITLPGVPVEAVGTTCISYTDLDGRYDLELPAGGHQLRIALGGYAEQLVNIEVVPGGVTEVQVSLTTNRFAEEVAVVAATLEAQSSTASAQMMMRMRAPSVQDNIGAAEMRSNNDSDAADAMSRVTGVSVVDNQSVFVRGLGERYSNTTLNGATLPTTEPDRRVVPLDLFPTGLIDSVQVSKTYTPDKPSQFAGGLVEIIPLKLPTETAYEFSLGGAYNSLTTGRSGLGYDGGSAWSGFDDGTRRLPAGFPDRKVIRGGRFTSDELGFLRSDLERLGEAFNNIWDPVRKDQPMNQSYSGLFGGRFGKLGVVATMRNSQNSQITNEQRTFYKVGSGGRIERFNGPYDFNETQFVSTVGGVGNLAYQINPNHRLSVDNFYTHVGTDETRTFEGFNSDADNNIRNQRLFFVEEQIRCAPRGRRPSVPERLEQPVRLEGRLLAGGPRRTGPARGAVRVRPRARGLRARRRVPERTAPVQRPRGRQPRVQPELVVAGRELGGASDPVQIRNQLYRSQPRLPLPAAAVRPDEHARARPLAAGRGPVHAEPHRPELPAQGGDAADRSVRRRPGDPVRLRHGGPPAGRPAPARRRGAGRELPAAGRHLRPVRPRRLR